MPGHKRNRMFFPDSLANFDLTEIPGMDNLRAPDGIIKDMQSRIAEFYGADESYILVNGSTAGITAAICAVCEEGSKLYAARNGHVSMYSGMAFSGALPIYIQPEVVTGCRGDGSLDTQLQKDNCSYRRMACQENHLPGTLAGGINPNVLDDMEEGAAAIIVSPTYEGFVSDIKAIADKVHSRGGILIVDEAHGAHFQFHSAFPESALQMGADIVVQSFHKTLPALGQLAVLHVKGPRVDTARLRFYIQAMQTTSPSYMLMAQLDYALSMLWSRPELFDMYVSRLRALTNALAPGVTQPVELASANLKGRYGIHDVDRGKLLFRININQSAVEISKILADEYRVQLEMAAGRHMLAMTSVADTDEGMQRLWAAIGAFNIRYVGAGLNARACEGKHITAHDDGSMHAPCCRSTPEQVLTPQQAARRATEVVPWEASAGRIAAEVIAAYPPGIAVVAPGERIPKGLPKTASHIRVIK